MTRKNSKMAVDLPLGLNQDGGGCSCAVLWTLNSWLVVVDVCGVREKVQISPDTFPGVMDPPQHAALWSGEFYTGSEGQADVYM